MPSPVEHPYLTGNYAPVPDETSITDLPVEGEVPAVLHGQFLQIGPNPIGNPARPYVWSHTDGMVHAVTLHPGRAPSYRNRWVMTATASRRLGTEPVPGDAVGGTDIANGVVVAVGDRILALSAHAGFELGRDLETRRRVHVSRQQRQLGDGVHRSSPRFAFVISRTGEMPYDGTEIRKLDLVAGTIRRRDFGARRHPGEPVFVADPAGLGADSGWLVGLVHDENTALAELVVLDARDLRSLATIHITRRVPYGLQCSWAPSTSPPKERS